MNFMFQRLLRTTSSEIYAIYTDEDEDDVGRIDLHYTSKGTVKGLLTLEEERTDEEVQALMQTIDDDIVSMADLDQGDFEVMVVTISQVRAFGKQVKGNE